VAFLEKIRSSDGNVRLATWRAAGPMGAPAVAPLGDLMAGEDKGVAKAAKMALTAIVHHAARPGAAEEARAVAAELLKLSRSDRSVAMRREVVYLLGFIGSGPTVADLASLLGQADLRDEARMALERIPGSASLNALKKALKTAPADFRPALEQSIRNRAYTPKTVGTIASR
jgi:hypothetical protein